MTYMTGNTVYYMWKPNYSFGRDELLYDWMPSNEVDTCTIISFRIMI